MDLSPNRIYSMDCIGFMDLLPEGSVDVIVTSPPYNLGKNYGPYGDRRDREEYLQWLGVVAERSRRILKDDGSFFLNIGGKPSDLMMPLQVAERFSRVYSLQNVIHWIKHISLPGEFDGGEGGLVSRGHFKPVNSDLYLSQSQEYVFHFTKSGKTRLDKLAIGVPYQDKSNVARWSRNKDIRDRGNVWFVPYETKVGHFRNPMLHPAEFPVELPSLCIRLHGIRPGMLVYDPFMGIGSTAIACAELGVSYVGTEINSEYIEIAAQRLEKFKAEGSGKRSRVSRSAGQ